jgi:hypothetical protein
MARPTRLQDMNLQRLVRTAASLRTIANEIGVSVSTACNIRKACAAVDSLPESTKKQARRLLLAKIPAGQIAARLGVPSVNIRYLKRLDRFRVDTEAEAKCSECGATLFAPTEHGPKQRTRLKRIRGNVSRDNVRTMSDIVVDLLELNELNLITHTLFHQLSQRAKEIYEKIRSNT